MPRLPKCDRAAQIQIQNMRARATELEKYGRSLQTRSMAASARRYLVDARNAFRDRDCGKLRWLIDNARGQIRRASMANKGTSRRRTRETTTRRR